MKQETVFVAMSGGVDSSMAAAILQEKGYKCIGVTLILTKNQETAKVNNSVQEAKIVAEQLNIEHRVLDLSDLFEEKVINYFINEYLWGKTPNPCVICNKWLKFGALLDYTLKEGGSFLATGHYAQIADDKEGFKYLYKAKDEKKDQTYFLYRLNSTVLEKVIFPLGEMTKEEVRKKAEKLKLIVANKKDSQEICFITDNDYRAFLKQKGVSLNKGLLKSLKGDILGEHEGIPFYTIGQRKGLGLKKTFSKPVFVKEIDAVKNEIILAFKEDCFFSGMFVNDFMFYKEDINLQDYKEIQVKIRYKAKPVNCNVTINGKMLEVKFDEAQNAITPGQFAVFYQNNTVLGGGVIDRAFNL